jgi:hypothetical protein
MRPVGTALFLDFELLDECSEMGGGTGLARASYRIGPSSTVQLPTDKSV